MKINEYLTLLANVGGESALSDGQKEAHELLSEASAGFTDQNLLDEMLEDLQIKETIEIYISQLSKKKIRPLHKDVIVEKKRNGVVFIRSGDYVIDNETGEKGKVGEIISSQVAVVNFEKTGYRTVILDTVTKVDKNYKSKISKPVKSTKTPGPKITKSQQPIKVTGGEVIYGDDIKFIRSFLAFLSGDQGRNRMANLYKRLSKQNAEKRFSNSKHKPELNEIASLLHDSINQGKSRVVLSASFKEKLLAIRDANHLAASVQVIKRFYNWIGSTPDIKQAENLLKSANKIDDSDKYYPEVKRIIYRLEKFIEEPKKGVIIDKPTIEGLAGVLKSYGCKLNRGKWEDAATKKA